MKFDTVIIGGGLSGLICGIHLAEQGQKCAIVTSGQSAIHFFSGSFGLLGEINGQEVTNPLETIASLPSKHPYQRIGIKKMVRLTKVSSLLLGRAGLKISGEAEQNHFVLTPMGTMKPSWLTIDDFTCFEQKDTIPYKHVTIVNLNGFLEFHTEFFKDGIAKLGCEADIKEITMDQFEAIRRNPCEMRSSNIAKVFDQQKVVDEFATKVNELTEETEAVVLPAVFGLFDPSITARLRSKIDKPVILIPALPPSVPGIRSQVMLRNRFQELGGTYLIGDNVTQGIFEENILTNIKTRNHGDIGFRADNFILASGSFFSKGIVATPEAIIEPTFGLDVDGDDDRSNRFDENIFNDQPFMHYGIKTNEHFQASINGKTIENLYVAGSALGGANPLKEGSGAGICLLSSINTANQILR